MSEPLSPETQAWLEADVAAVYERFLDRVSVGRDAEIADVEKVASGRVWTGAQAAEIGLVDGVGGLREALREAKTRAGLEPDSDAMLVIYPPPQALSAQIRDALGLRLDPLQSLPGVFRRPLRRVRAWVDAAAVPGPTLVAPYWIEVH